MKFSLKVFLAIFGVVVFVLAVSEFVALRYVTAQAETQYIERYQQFSKQLGDTFLQFDKTTDLVMQNALYVLRERERKHGLLSNEELVKLRQELGMAVLYITDKAGNYIRSDWFITAQKDPALRTFYKDRRPLSKPLFSFCEDYKHLVDGQLSMAKTPILLSNDTKRSVKFLMIPNHDRTRVLEADMLMSFIGELLENALKSDPSVVSIGIFTPTGQSLGYVEARKSPMGTNSLFTELQPHGKNLIFTTKVNSAEENCCECRLKGLAANDGTYYYTLRTEISRALLDKQLAHIRNWFLCISFISFCLSILLAYFVSRRLVSKLEWMDKRVQQIAISNDLGLRLNMAGRDEIATLAATFDGMIDQLQTSQSHLATAEREKAFVQLARQVAHDIRSPLAALDTVVKNISLLAEEHRIIIRTAVGRVRDIANNLLNKYREVSAGIKATTVDGTEPSIKEPMVNCLLSSLIESLITEKRLQYRSLLGVEIDSRLDEFSYGLFAKVQPGEFKRVISNLINNAVEALEGHTGSVLVTLYARKGLVFVQLEDTGKGIGPDLLAKLEKQGQSHSKLDGCGLGLQHAQACAKAWGGYLKLASKVGQGTTANLILPQAQAPDWFVSELVLNLKHIVIILDDDTSIHQIWQGRLDALFVRGRDIEALHFSTPRELRDWVVKNPQKAYTALYLLDYELLGYEETGLSLAEELGLGERIVLVTSRYEEQEILEGCRRLNARMIPKGLAGLVPIRISELPPQKDGAERPIAGEHTPKRWDAVLIDDDFLVRKTWSLAAAKFGKTLLAFESPAEFFREVSKIDRSTVVYIDEKFPNGVNGSEISAEIYALGFREIFLETGYAMDIAQKLKHLKGVVGKEPPWAKEFAAP